MVEVLSQAQEEKEETANGMIMSSSISDLARIIDPSLIGGDADDHGDAAGADRGLEREGSPLTASTVMPPLSGWSGLGTGVETGTLEGEMEEALDKKVKTMNGKNGTAVVDDHVHEELDVDMDRPSIRGRVGKVMEGDSTKGREEWIRQIERRKGTFCPVIFSLTAALDHAGSI